MDKKLTDAEIVKALEICSKGIMFSKHDCKKCPYYAELCCERKLKQNALDLINRLQAENEKNENIIRLADKTIETQQAENDRLKEKAEKIFEATINKFLSIKDHYVIIDGEFVECEMMEELESLFNFEFCEFNEDYKEKLDNLLKELVGDTQCQE